MNQAGNDQGFGQDPFFEDLPGGEIDVAKYFAMVRRHWRLVLIIVVVALMASVVQYSLTSKSYRANTLIEIKRDSNVITGVRGLPVIDYRDARTFYPSQFQILESRGQGERVVKALRLWEDPAFNPDAEEWIREKREPTELEMAAFGQHVRTGLSVVQFKETHLVSLSYVTDDPRLAAKLANGYAEVYRTWREETARVDSDKTSSLIEQQIDFLKSQIVEKERELQGKVQEMGGSTTQGGATVVGDQLQALNRDYIAAYSERVNQESKLSALRSMSISEYEKLATGRAEELRDRLEQKRGEYEVMQKTFKPEWPALKTLKEEIGRLRLELETAVAGELQGERKRVQTDLQSASLNEQQLAKRVEELRSNLQRQNIEKIGVLPIEVELATWRAILNSLLEGRSQRGFSAQLQDASGEDKVRIVEKALQPKTHFRPSLRRDLMMGGGLGLAIGLAAAFLIEFLDRTVKTGEELEKALGLATLGIIPDVSDELRGYGYFSRYGYGYGYGSGQKAGGKKKRRSEPVKIELVPRDRPRLAVAEAYRSMRTALLLSSADTLSTITMTSAEAGEGKTATSSNLAVVMAQLGKRVVLVDADLRKPRQHRVFGASNQAGLVNLLTGSADIADVAIATQVPNLTLIAAGPHPPNPSELLASKRMGEIVAELRRTYDFVILDTPPVLAVTDPIIVGSISDGIVLCTQAGRVARQDLRQCRDRLLQSEVRILGVVLNRYRDTKRGYGKRYHYYSAYAEEVDQEVSGSAA